MEQFKQFNVEKQAAISTLSKLREILEELGGMDIDVQDDLNKIAGAISTIESDVLRIALLGAFSDGKTSVVAAWLGKIMDNMNIAMDESSDQLAIYKPEGLPGQCEIVDTPGLFGDKEKTVEGEQVMYEDVTKRYISEAHLIFYVVDATNPLKESHSAIAKWVLRDLNKLSSTVFVINKMDEVTDLTEQTLFDAQAAIKKDNLKSKLQRAANLTPDELARLNIVCIASNPNGRGLGRREVKRLAGELSGELQAMERQLLGRLRPLSQEDIHGFLEDEIGCTQAGTGYKLNLKIKTTIDSFFEQSSAVTSRISDDIGRQLNSSESFLDAMSQGALKSMGGALKGISKLNPSVIKGTIFAARDVLGQVTGIAVKFKPWEAAKLAGTISKWAGPAGAVISLGSDAYKAYKARELEEVLTQTKESIASVIKDTFKDIYDLISDDEKMFDFFAPQLKEFERIVSTMSANAEQIRTSRNKVAHIQTRLNVLALPSLAT